MVCSDVRNVGVALRGTKGMATIQTYIPLYRKYRPASFSQVVGQQAIVQTLTNAIENQKVAHAYLFCGPRGTGKTSTARIFAKSLNCINGPTVTPCQTCDSCTGINNGNALDVIEFDAASNNSVDDARELIENCQFAPMSGRYKVYIIDEVHMLSTAAFNALLKTLEEPPPNVIFIFATTEAHKVLPTIISRCQRFDLSRITRDDIMVRLADIAQQEGFTIADDALSLIARHAKGGLRDAIGLLDQVSVMARIDTSQSVTIDVVAHFIGALEEEVLLQLSQTIAQQNATTLLTLLQQLEAQGIEAGRLVKELTQHFRNLFLVRVSGESATAAQLELGEDYYNGLKAQALLFAVEELPQLLEKLSQIERNLRGHSQGQLWLEVGLLEMAYREDIHLVKNLAQRVSDLEKQLQTGGIPQTTQATPATSIVQSVSTPAVMATSIPQGLSSTAIPASASATLTQGGSLNWPELVARIPNTNIKALLKQHTFLLSQNETQVVIGCSSDPILQLIKKPDKFIHIQKAVEAAVGHAIGVQVVLEKNQQVPAGQTIDTPPMTSLPVETLPRPASIVSAAPEPLTLSSTVIEEPLETVTTEPSITMATPSVAIEEPSLVQSIPATSVSLLEVDAPPLSEDDVEAIDIGEPLLSPDTVMYPSSNASLPTPMYESSLGEPIHPEQLEEAKQYTVQLLQGKVVD